jgi:hypothetical protein
MPLVQHYGQLLSSPPLCSHAVPLTLPSYMPAPPTATAAHCEHWTSTHGIHCTSPLPYGICRSRCPMAPLLPFLLPYCTSLQLLMLIRLAPSAILCLAAASAFASASTALASLLGWPTLAPPPAIANPPTPPLSWRPSLPPLLSHSSLACSVYHTGFCAPISVVIRVLELKDPIPFQGPVRTLGGEE